MAHSIYDVGMIRVAACMPEVALAEPIENARRIAQMSRVAAAEGAALIAFPELALTGYALDDLFRQSAVQQAVHDGLAGIAEETADLEALLIFGAPLISNGQLFNCAVVMAHGRVLGVVPKTYLPNYSEFYEGRQFASAWHATSDVIKVCGQQAPFGTDQLFEVPSIPNFIVGMDICEDLWAPIPPSTYAALAGATVLVNLSASNASVGKAAYRETLVSSHSARCLAAQIYVGEGPGDSTTDLAWDTHSLIAENGVVLAESERYAESEQMLFADLDLERLAAERMRITSFRDAQRELAVHGDWVSHAVPLQPPIVGKSIRDVARNPYVPSDLAARKAHADEVRRIQVNGLVKRVKATGIQRLVIGVSGGLDSALALVVAAQAMDALGRSRADIIGVSMPGFGTTKHTRGNALALMKALGVDVREIDIRPASEVMLSDIQHPTALGTKDFDVTYENVQAGARTSLLFRLANHVDGIVIGTGDLSELALGWCTYGVGDHMSHYSVNASVPKTLVRHILQSMAEQEDCPRELRDVLLAIIDTPISPELLPADSEGSLPQQRSEDVVGPYELQDFFLYYTTRFGFGPKKLLFLAQQAWGNEVPPAELERWLRVFLERFFGQSQFKRSAIPNAPKVGTGGSLSPRGDWRAPSDTTAATWLNQSAW